MEIGTFRTWLVEQGCRIDATSIRAATRGTVRSQCIGKGAPHGSR